MKNYYPIASHVRRGRRGRDFTRKRLISNGFVRVNVPGSRTGDGGLGRNVVQLRPWAPKPRLCVQIRVLWAYKTLIGVGLRSPWSEFVLVKGHHRCLSCLDERMNTLRFWQDVGVK